MNIKFDTEEKSINIAEQVLEMDLGGKHLLRANTDGAFWHYSGTHWYQLPTSIIQKFIFDRFIVAFPERKSLATKASKSGLAYLQLEVLAPEPTEELAPEQVINTPNAEIYLSKSGAITAQPHKYDSFLTTLIDTPYSAGAEAPCYTKALQEIFCDASEPEEVIRHLMEVFGVILSADRREPLIVMFIGKGSNGKTRLAQTLERLLGQDAVLARPLSAMSKDQFFDAGLLGKLLFIDDDLGADTVLPDGRLKKLSEAKLITARQPHGRTFSFTSTVVPMLIANHLPKTRDLSEGLKRRLQIFRFDKVFKGPEKDENLFETIWATEMPGILNMCLDGYVRFVKRGNFAPPVECKKAIDDWIAEANAIATFISEECSTYAGYKEKGTLMFDAFQLWGKMTGHTSLPNRTEFYAGLEKLGYKKTKDNNAAHFKGLKLNIPGDDVS